MKVLSIITKFPNYINHYYRRHPKIKNRSFKNQYESVVNDTLGSFETWSAGLSKLGYQCERIFATIPELQKRWAQEQGIVYDESNWMESILLAQIKEFQPNILIISKQSTYSPGYVNNLRHEIPSIRLIISWCGSPYKDLSIFREYDFILSCIPELVEDFNSKGHRCYHLNHAFDPRVLDKIDANRVPLINFSFVGAIVKAAEHHINRESLLIELTKDTDLTIWSDTKNLSQRRRLRILAAQLSYDIMQGATRIGLSKDQLAKTPRFGKLIFKEKRPDFMGYNDFRVIKRANPPVYGPPMYQKLRDSKVTLNTHIEISPRSASNMRLFEATGVGTCLLTDWKENLNTLFEPDVEVASYRNSRECIEKVKFLLQNEKERLAIAEAGQRRTLQDHTIYKRAEQLDDIIKGYWRKHKPN